MEFSPCGQKLSIASRNGYCLIIKTNTDDEQSPLTQFTVDGEMRAYFGGFLCSSWSPTGRFLACGGEDDLITVMSTETGKIVARCQETN